MQICSRQSGLVLPMLVFAFCGPVRAQSAPAAHVPSREQPLGIYVDCQNITCDFEYLRTEISFVTYVRDRHDADVHVLITAQPTAEGGTEATLTFIGLRAFQGQDDSLRYIAGPTATADQLRRGLAEALKRGLVRYVNHTSVAEGLTIGYTPPPGSTAVPRRDPWNYWTFNSTLQALVNGEQSVNATSVALSATASRTTNDWKINTGVFTQYNKTAFNVDGATIESIQRSHAFSALVVKSRDEHTSVGGRGSVSASTFLNQSLTVRLAPAVEYNFFPYRQSNSRIFTIEYSIGVTAFDYREETIFGKSSETLFDQQVLASLRFTQPWGSAAAGVELSNYLHDFDKHRGILFGNVDWNVAKGLSLTTLVNVQRISDQIFLPARAVSQEEILLRQRQLATSYSYSISFGVSYRFGSPYADVVNPRFAGSVGGVSLTQ
jgi:hypothetical protein